MIVVGGTYRESVVVPDSDELAGSGMRAAAALYQAAGGAPMLYTALDEATRPEAEMVASALGVRLAAGVPDRDEPIGFRYYTPISAPAVNGPNSRTQEPFAVDAAGETALVFGLVEAPQQPAAGKDENPGHHAGINAVTVDADTIVLDPQRPRDAEPLSLNGLNARDVYVVANSAEITKLGRSTNIRIAASGVLDRFDRIRGVITKRGAAGCLVTFRSGDDVTHEIVGAHPTRKVWPIGSGDVFSAGVAHAIDNQADLVEAAKIGSAAAAHWCSTRAPAIPAGTLRGQIANLPRPIRPTTPKVYLAGPFFTISERWLVETVRDELGSLGAEVWSPVHEVGPGGLEVAQKDLDGLLECDAVLALLDHGDPGTVFEVGWAVHHGIPVIGYGLMTNPEGAKMMAGTAVELHTDLATACYRTAWAGMGLQPRPGWMQ